MERKNKLNKNKNSRRSQRKLIISDFDDTLFFTDKSMALASKEITGRELVGQELIKLERTQKREVYLTAFRKYKESLYPNEKLILKYKKFHSSGYEIIVMSARGEELRVETKYGLEKYEIPSNRIILADTHYKISDGEWKLSMLNELVEGYDEVLFFDDRIDNIEYIKERFKDPKVRYFLVNKRGKKELKTN